MQFINEDVIRLFSHVWSYVITNITNTCDNDNVHNRLLLWDLRQLTIVIDLCEYLYILQGVSFIFTCYVYFWYNLEVNTMIDMSI